MAFVRTVPESDAAGLLKEIYDGEVASDGYIHNYVRTLSLHPELVLAYRSLIKTVRERVDLRRYELITFAVSAAVRCSY
jgi:hypothetical protein